VSPDPVPAEGAVGAVAAALPVAAPRHGRTRVLAVDGRSGAGKTTFADRLVPLLREQPGRTVGLLHLDELYPGWDGLAAAVPLLVEGVLRPLAQGRPAGFTGWDWAAGAPGRWRPVPADDVLVLEGAGCGSRPCAPYLSLLVWLEAPEQLRRRRALARDGDLYTPHWDRWAAQEDLLLAAERTAERADLVLDTTDLPAGG
jgi:hypothetical protein